ncbi:MAG: PIN domain-containing protein, partial [Pseudomonadota bacterium]|nr:PIN domain-containing protein [Pseudomonadota bacterium]
MRICFRYTIGFFASAEVDCLEITAQVIEKAAHLRAALNVKTPDAIHLSTAILSGAKAFLTGDRELTKCADIVV